LARVAHALLPHLVGLVQAGEKRIERKLTHWLGHQRFDLHVGELARESDQAAEYERFARDIHPREIVARVGLGVPVLHGRAESGRLFAGTRSMPRDKAASSTEPVSPAVTSTRIGRESACAEIAAIASSAVA